jgi:hypothetical protein
MVTHNFSVGDLVKIDNLFEWPASDEAKSLIGETGVVVEAEEFDSKDLVYRVAVGANSLWVFESEIQHVPGE